MKRLLSVCLAASLCAAASAQDLDTVNFVDQLDSGTRGNNTGSGQWGASASDGTEYEDYTGDDLSGTASFVRYISTFATDGSPESPVLDVTVSQTNPDRPGTTMNLLPISPNNRRAANDESGETAVFIGDDGGYNGLWFGESDDANYFVEVDIYAPVFTPSNPLSYEVSGVAVRAGRDNDTGVDPSYNVDRAGGYALVYDTHQRTFSARKWLVTPNTGVIDTRDETYFEEYGTLEIEDSGWYTLKVVANGQTIDFYVNNSLIGTVTEGGETAYASGRPGLYYREGGATGTGVPSADETQGIFDHLRAGPASEANVNDWSMY